MAESHLSEKTKITLNPLARVDYYKLLPLVVHLVVRRHSTVHKRLTTALYNRLPKLYTAVVLIEC